MKQQLEECEKQLQNEVERGQAANEASSATLRRAAQRESELEQQLAHAEERARTQDEQLLGAHKEASNTMEQVRKAARDAEEAANKSRLELDEITTELRNTESA